MNALVDLLVEPGAALRDRVRAAVAATGLSIGWMLFHDQVDDPAELRSAVLGIAFELSGGPAAAAGQPGEARPVRRRLPVSRAKPARARPGRRGRADQRQHPVGKGRGQRDHRGRPHHPGHVNDRVDHPLQVGIRLRDHPAQHVPRPGDRVHLQHFGNHGQAVRHRVMPARLADFQRHERGDAVAEGRRVDVRAEPGDHPASTASGPAGPEPFPGPRPAAGTPRARRPGARRGGAERAVRRDDRSLACSHPGGRPLRLYKVSNAASDVSVTGPVSRTVVPAGGGGAS